MTCDQVQVGELAVVCTLSVLFSLFLFSQYMAFKWHAFMKQLNVQSLQYSTTDLQMIPVSRQLAVNVTVIINSPVKTFAF